MVEMRLKNYYKYIENANMRESLGEFESLCYVDTGRPFSISFIK